jgi:hypothetical protein
MAYQKICFVIMGFGKRTDFSTGKTFDLDQTYKNIINPAVLALGYKCVRADEIKESGLIDKSMYALLMQADLVIADISTYNPNAIYELGIRHAVRPYATIILKENSEAKIPFDLDHTRIFKYAHLGDDIGVDEAERCSQALTDLIKAIEKDPKADSPLYEFVRDIQPPHLPEAEYTALIKELADTEKHIFAIVERAMAAMAGNNFVEATKLWERASAKAANEPYFIQQQALCRYKSGQPSKNTALLDALQILQPLKPDESNDPETLGLAGAIYKNLWLLQQDPAYLDRAINYYGKGFKLRNDYYTGENYALSLNMKSQLEKDNDERIYLKMESKKTRQSIVTKLEADVEVGDFNQRVDRKWVYATLSQCFFALGDDEKARFYEVKFLESEIVQWEEETFINTRSQLKELLA